MQTKTVTVNPAFLEEIKEVHHDLWAGLDELRQACERPLVYRRSGAEVVELLARLRDQLALQFALEEAYGYFEGAVRAAPHLTEAAAALRAEHAPLYVAICSVVEAGEQFPQRSEPALLVSHITPTFNKFDQLLRRHEERENALIVQAYEEDIGGGD